MFSLRRLAPQHLLPLLRPRQKSPRRALSLQFRTISTVSKLGRFGMGRVCKSSHESCAFADSSSGQLRRKITTATAVLADGLAKDSPTKLASDSEEDAFLPEDESLQTNSNASGRSFIYVAIDGDDCWFHPSLVQKGREGGWQAAEWLLSDLRYCFALDGNTVTDIVVQLFVNQRGNAQSYFKAFDIPYQISDPFYQGLAESRPLVNVIPAGNAKEAADNKLSGALRFHAGLQECQGVGFAGLGDSSYSAIIRELLVDGFREKLVLFKTSD
ncbi:hypothetical protein P389DRAFT_51128 [Cystobasidium minutum MCA 4210]|uniref:uncharacterized protein n=1 Tax=Cystobasidium minutum MCA 4210 TaxID=1397322 RepID=UPI0034CD61AD|eukprot:jgi/Rhomi1/51128/CE51127_73